VEAAHVDALARPLTAKRSRRRVFGIAAKVLGLSIVSPPVIAVGMRCHAPGHYSNVQKMCYSERSEESRAF
jgi:hypothetical protein